MQSVAGWRPQRSWGIMEGMATHDHHDHHHGHDHGELDATELRVRALQTLLAEKGYIDPAALDAIVDT